MTLGFEWVGSPEKVIGIMQAVEAQTQQKVGGGGVCLFLPPSCAGTPPLITCPWAGTHTIGALGSLALVLGLNCAPRLPWASGSHDIHGIYLYIWTSIYSTYGYMYGYTSCRFSREP